MRTKTTFHLSNQQSNAIKFVRDLVIRTKKNKNQLLPKENNTNSNQMEDLERPQETQGSGMFSWK